MTTSNKPFWILMSLTASTVFSFIAPFAIMAEEAGLSPAYAVLYRYIILVAIATPFIFIFARQHFNFSRKHFWLLILQSCATAILNVSYMMSFTFIPLSLAVIIFFTSPIITLMVVPFIFGGRPTLPKIIIFIIAFLGLIMVVGPQFNNLNPIGITLAFIAAITSVIQLICMSILVKEISPAALLYSVHFNAMLITAAIIGALVYYNQLPMPAAFNTTSLINFAGIVLCYVTGYSIFTIVAKNLEPATISFAANIEPIVTIALAIWLFNETLSGVQAIGVVVVIGALIIGSLLKEKRA
ncbi:MAG: DMT family transporter [Hyphomicrobiales bacterium]